MYIEMKVRNTNNPQHGDTHIIHLLKRKHYIQMGTNQPILFTFYHHYWQISGTHYTQQQIKSIRHLLI